MKKVIVIDNYDSFTYNLVQLVRESNQCEVVVKRNDEFQIDEIEAFDKIILSPGPGLPSEAGLMPQVVEKYSKTKQILGICLGHQCIGEIFGGKLENLKQVVHGKGWETKVLDTDNYLFQNVPAVFESGRYHSWVVSKDNFPDCLEITAIDNNDSIMGLKHKTYDVQGLQFHPESVLTPEGRKIMGNWLCR